MNKNWLDKIMSEANIVDWRGLTGIGVRLNDVNNNYFTVIDITKDEWISCPTQGHKYTLINNKLNHLISRYE